MGCAEDESVDTWQRLLLRLVMINRNTLRIIICKVLSVGLMLPASAGEVAQSPAVALHRSQQNDRSRPTVAAQAGSLAQEAIVLRAEAARMGSNLQRFSLHVKKFENGALHKEISAGAKRAKSHQHKTPDNVISTGVKKGATSTNAAQQHIENVAKLQKEYGAHVAQYRAIAIDYRKFYVAYIEHRQRYQQLLERCKLDNQRTQQSLSQTKKDLAAVENGEEVLKAEDGIADVLKRMFDLQQQSPNLAESYLCPAYEDLHKEFVQSISGLETSIEAVPADQRAAVAHEEIDKLQVLKQQMTDAEELHNEQQLLQQQFAKMLHDTKTLHDEEPSLGTAKLSK